MYAKYEWFTTHVSEGLARLKFDEGQSHCKIWVI